MPLIKKAKEMGLHTIVASYQGNYPGLALADEVWDVGTTEHLRLLALAKSKRISGVCTTGTDVAIYSLGYLCDHLNLCGIPETTAKLLTNKALMKDAFKKGGVSTPDFYAIASAAEAYQAFKSFGTSVIVKAVDSSGSRGITKVECEEELAPALNAANIVTKKSYVLIEEFIEGHEIGVDGFVSDGKIQFILPHDKFIYTTNGTTIPEGHQFPYHCSEKLMAAILHQIELVVAATGMNYCAFNADILIRGEDVYVLEVGGRAGATCIPELISIYCGFDYYEQMIHQALGEPVSFSMKAPVPCMAKLLFSNCDGWITAINERTLERLRSPKLQISLDVPAGAPVTAVGNGTHRFGQVLMETDDVATFNSSLRYVRRAIKINGISLGQLWTE